MTVLAEVKTPGNGKTYEIMFDDKMTVGAVKEKIKAEITAFENGSITFDDTAVLFLASAGELLADNRNMKKAGFRSGGVLLLV